MTARWVVVGLMAMSLGLSDAPAWAADGGLRKSCITFRTTTQHLKILSAQLEETGKADPRLWRDLHAALAQMNSWLQERRRDYQGATQAEGRKRLGELEGRLRRIERGVSDVEQASDQKAAARRLIPGLLQQLEAYGRATAALP